MRGSSPCPPGDGNVETWCDDAGNCQFRVVGGPSFTCDAGDSAGCTQAAQDAANACISGVAGRIDGGTGVPATGLCDELCAMCGNHCGDCESLEQTAHQAGCQTEFSTYITCVEQPGCCGDPEACAQAGTCTDQAASLASCGCPTLLPTVSSAAAACGRSFDYTCDDSVGLGAAVVFACAPKIDSEGCAAFDAPECGNF